MLYFVGLGISGAKSIPLEAQDILSKADIVYLEQFTSPIGKSDLAKIGFKAMIGGALASWITASIAGILI